MKKKLFSACLLTTALLAGCGGGTINEADVEGCEHLQEGPSSIVTATSSATDAPDVFSNHRRYDISLVDVTGGKGGFVSFDVAHAAEYILFTGADVPVVVRNAAGEMVAFEATAKASPECTDVKGRHTVELAVGTYTFNFGPTLQGVVSLVIEEVAHEH
jgi:hypothetical protein